MPTTEFQVVSALQRRKAAKRTRVALEPPATVATSHATPTRLTRDDLSTRNVRTTDRSALLARIAACDPAPHVPGITDYNADALHATPEMIRGLSVVPHVPDPTVTESTWERTLRVQRDSRANVTHARDCGCRFTLRGVAPTFEGRVAEVPTVLVHYSDGARTLPVARFDRKESVWLRALHEHARRENVARDYNRVRELTLRETIRVRALATVGGSQAQYD